MSHPLITDAAARLDVALAFRGDLSLLERPRRCLLVSRGERHPQPDAPWLRGIVAHIPDVVARGEVLVTGVERCAFDVALWLCAQRNGAAIVALATRPAEDSEWLRFLPERHLLVWPAADSKALTLEQRDTLVGLLADRATRIHVRRGGHMAALAESLVARGCPVDDAALPEPAGRSAAEATTADCGRPGAVNSAPTEWAHLTHFTRAADGAWPGESRAEYLRWLCGGADAAPRDGFAALRRILFERCIRACGKLMPGGAPMVCFTACQPLEVAKLRRWRKGLARWSFTPYGLAIRKTALVERAAQPVIYTTHAAIDAAPSSARRWMQVAHSGDLDWSLEAEWRVAGDVRLDVFAPGELLALVARPMEAQRIEAEFGVATRVLSQ